jgi:predicted amidohydrolase
MAKDTRLTAIQPPHPSESIDTDAMLARTLSLIDKAGQAGSDIALLPELVNVYPLKGEQAWQKAETELDSLASAVAKRAKLYRMHIILPVLEKRSAGYFNTAWLFGRDGELLGKYDKVHLTPMETDFYGVKAGSDYPVFDLDFGRIGLMICLDGVFAEPSIIYALQGVDVLFWPRWMSGHSEISFEIQMRCRAIDYALHIVSSSFGVPPTVAWRPGMLFGRSCVISHDGTIIADAGHQEGIATAVVDLEHCRLVQRLDPYFGDGYFADLRKIRLAERRPDTYGLIVKSRPTTDDS